MLLISYRGAVTNTPTQHVVSGTGYSRAVLLSRGSTLHRGVHQNVDYKFLNHLRRGVDRNFVVCAFLFIQLNNTQNLRFSIIEF